MTLHMIGLGLSKKAITLEGLEAIKKCEKVFLENYTAVLECSKEELEKVLEKQIILASRDLVEKESDKILEPAESEDVAFLVVGDVFGATTHNDLWLRAKERNIETKIYHNTSIMNAVSETGLELYDFGKTTSIVFDDDGWLPETPYNIIKENKSRGLHTLCLLDIKVAEPSKGNLLKGINKPEPPRFMTVTQAIKILKKLEEKKKENIISDELFVVGVARLGQKDKIIKAGKLKDIEKLDFGREMHSLIIPGRLDDIEKEVLKEFNI